MTTPPRPPAPAPRPARPATALPGAITYVLLGAAALITDDGDTGTPALLHAGAGCACAMHGLPASLAPVIYRRAALCLARASGYQPLDTADPVIDRALDELLGYPPERQARLLTYAARRAATTPPDPCLPRTHTRKGDSYATPRLWRGAGVRRRVRSAGHRPGMALRQRALVVQGRRQVHRSLARRSPPAPR
jgi:hypothetical protein